VSSCKPEAGNARSAAAWLSTVGVIGIGSMGSRIARRLLEAGHGALLWNRNRDRLRPLLDVGATEAASPADAARRAEVVITTVSDPTALRAVTEGGSGIAAGARQHLTVIEMSTVGPAAIRRLASILPRGTRLLDAPVVGSLAEAEAGSLQILVGGPASSYLHWTPLLSLLGTPVHTGPLGSGAAAKLVANASVFAVVAALGESIALSKALGLTRDVAFQVLSATPLATQAKRRQASIEADEYPRRFALELAHKDAALITDAASARDVDLRVCAVAARWLADASAAGWGKRDYTAILGWIQVARSADPRGAR
jgi:3-hydroxyisobutyrate dehydrogenase